MPAIDWNYGSLSYRKLAPFLIGEFTCQRCGAQHNTWHPMCNWCDVGAIRPLPLIPEEREFLFWAEDILQVLQWKSWHPRALKEVGIEPIIERFLYPTAVSEFFFRRISDLKSAGPFFMALCDHQKRVTLEARKGFWGPVPFVGFDVNEFERLVRPLDTVQVKVTAMVPLNLFGAVT